MTTATPLEHLCEPEPLKAYLERRHRRLLVFDRGIPSAYIPIDKVALAIGFVGRRRITQCVETAWRQQLRVLPAARRDGDRLVGTLVMPREDYRRLKRSPAVRQSVIGARVRS